MGKIFNLSEICRRLSQRSPLLLLDRAEQLDDNHFVGLKALSFDELFFQGHFPGQPIMPGVLQVEAMKQLAELALRPQLDKENTLDIHLTKLEKVKFRRPNFPGDRLKIEIEIEKVENGLASVKGSVSNASGLAAEAQMTLGARPRSGASSMPAFWNEFDRTDAIPMDINKILAMMPHRYPFMLIDNIVKIDGDTIVATKNVTGGEPFFAGIAAENPTLPEPLLCEIIAQSGCSHVLARPGNEGKIAYFLSIEEAEFLAPVHPGDQLVLEIELPPARARFGKGIGCIKVDGKVIFTATIMFAIVPKAE